MNFSWSFKPLFFLSRLFGCFPFTIVRNQSDIIVGCCVSVFDIVLFVLNIVLHMIIVAFSYPISTSEMIKFEKATTHFSLTGIRVLTVGHNIAAVISIVLNLLNRNRFIEIFKAFDAFDNEVYI